MKITLSVLIVVTVALPLHAMEKNNTDPFPYQELLPELKQLILSIGAQTATIPDAINHFKNLRATSKQFNTQQATSVFLDALLAEYPNQEIRIAKLLKTPAAYQWLNGVRAKKGLPAYQEKNTNAADVRSIHTAVYQGYTNEVKKWLEQGFDPNDILSLVIDQSPSNKAVELLTLLIAYGADVNKQFTSRRGSKTISLLYQVTRTKNLQKKSDAITRYTDIIAYLVSEGARLNPGEQELLAK